VTRDAVDDRIEVEPHSLKQEGLRQSRMIPQSWQRRLAPKCCRASPCRVAALTPSPYNRPFAAPEIDADQRLPGNETSHGDRSPQALGAAELNDTKVEPGLARTRARVNRPSLCSLIAAATSPLSPLLDELVFPSQ